jgi:hypothetical protein
LAAFSKAATAAWCSFSAAFSALSAVSAAARFSAARAFCFALAASSSSRRLEISGKIYNILSIVPKSSVTLKVQKI